MRFALRATVAAVAIATASPAFADIVMLPASDQQGVNVHGVGPETTGPDVVANLGANGPNIVHFTGDTDSPTNNDLRLQVGEGQADITGAEIAPGGNPEGYNLLSCNIFLTGNEGMDWIEFALTSEGQGGTVDFFLTDDGGTVFEFLNVMLGNGNTHFGFDAINGQLITNVFFQADAGTEIDILKQVRILREGQPGVVPEPSTWAMMLLGFGAAGYAMRRRRRKTELAQIA